MHPEITRAMVEARQAGWARPSAKHEAQLRSDVAAASARAHSRRRPLGGTVRAALRLRPSA